VDEEALLEKDSSIIDRGATASGKLTALALGGKTSGLGSGIGSGLASGRSTGGRQSGGLHIRENTATSKLSK